MLVLSRRLNEKIVFPGIATAVTIVSVKPGLVRLGIEAPPEVAVLREELARPSAAACPLPAQVCRRLDTVSTGLAQLRRQLTRGDTRDTDATLERLTEELQALRRHLKPAPRCAAPAPG